MQIGWFADYPDPDDFMYILLGCPDGKANRPIMPAGATRTTPTSS